MLQRLPEPASPLVVQPPPVSIDAVAAPPGMTTQRMIAWGALGGSVLMLGGALAAQVMHDQAATTYNDDALCEASGQWRDDRCGGYRNKAQSAQTYANLGYIGAGALGAASAILFLVDTRGRKPKTRGGMTWSIAATGSSAEFVAVGCW